MSKIYTKCKICDKEIEDGEVVFWVREHKHFFAKEWPVHLGCTANK